MRRQRRTRAKISGSSSRPRLAVFRSNRFFYAQLIDDEKGKTLAATSPRELEKESKKMTKTKQAEVAGKLIAEKAAKAGIRHAVLDRRSYRYHGRVKTFADAVRKHGLQI